jgi:hypothetical protein
MLELIFKEIERFKQWDFIMVPEKLKYDVMPYIVTTRDGLMMMGKLIKFWNNDFWFGAFR